MINLVKPFSETGKIRNQSSQHLSPIDNIGGLPNILLNLLYLIHYTKYTTDINNLRIVYNQQ